MQADDRDERRDQDLDATVPMSGSPLSPPSSPSAAEQRVGPYRLIEKIGEGGMGEVWAAEQDRPIRRRVALKIVKRDLASREFMTRFAAEQQALALMDHPYIAHVHDGGTTERGRPYFVMEYVEGVTILRHCDDRRASVRQRVELFCQVCEGIQHAHQKAIIHRDIKPSNVLVSIQDGMPRPKIIDFGVAKALDMKLTEETLQTEMGQLIGSPLYMSPEQADLTGRNVDTRTDIYLLGVMFYELLAGVLPFKRSQWQEGGLPRLLEMIREVEPPRPSRRVADLGPGAADVASRRSTKPDSLVEQLCGELDWIAMMALEKDRSRRYQTVGALIQDLQSYLRDEPVKACPPSRTYRLRKFARRNRTGVVAAAVVLGAVVLGIFGTTVGMVQARRAERVALSEARAAREVADFMVGMFNVADPGEARGNSITVREVLDRGVVSIETGLENQPRTQARLLNTMGRVYKELGLYGPARPLLERTLSLLRATPDEAPSENATARNDLGTVLWKTGDYGASRVNLEASLAIREAELGPDHPDVAQSLNSLGNLEWVTGHHDQARQYYERALTIRERTLGLDHPDVAITLNNLGGLSMALGDHTAAKQHLERALAIRERVLGEDHPDVANSLANLGSLAATMGDPVAARDDFERSLAIREKVLGPEHPQVAVSLKSLAGPLEDLGDQAGAQAAYERALTVQMAALGPHHPDVANTLTNYGVLLRNRGDRARARELFARALGIWEGAAGDDNVMVAACQCNMAVVLMDLGDFGAAQQMLEKALTIQLEHFGPDHQEVVRTLKNLGDACLNQHDHDQARDYYQRSIATAERLYGPDHPDVAIGLHGYGKLLTEANELDAAQAALERAAAIRETSLGPQNLDLASALSDLAMVFYIRGDHDAARRTYRRALEIQANQLPPDSPPLRDNCYNMACLTARAGDVPGALAYLRRAVDGGFANAYIEEDPDLVSLHGEPEYADLVQQVKRRVVDQ
jgi:non-specific serine/threonine protein kinase/serine/threonine-protein kinase